MKVFKTECMHNTSHRERGFTLIEILIALAIMSIVTTAIYQIFINQQKTWLSQDLVTEMQQNSRVSIDTISRDLLMAGYGVTTAIETDSATTASNATQIAIRYKDPNDSNKIKRIMYWMDATENILYRKEDTATSNAESSLPGRVWGSGQPLADNVTALTFTYFNQNGDVLAMPPNDVYRIKVSLQVRTSRKDPVTLDWKYLILSTDARPRNIGIGGVAADTTPPEVPGRPTVTDPQICGTLDVSWSPVANAGSDLAGYVLYVGVAPQTYTRKIPLGDVTSYTLTGLDNGATYYIALTSRDNSGNESAYSDEAFTGDGTANDTTPDADVPGQPVWLDEAATASTSGAPWVELKWKANSETYPTDSDIKGYQVWRKGNSEGEGAWTNLTPTLDTLITGTTYRDSTIPEAGKCSIYDYRIVAVNACNTSLVSTPSSTVFGDKDSTSLADQPTNGVTNTSPSDGTKPPAPSYNGGIVKSKAGYRQTFINWDNPDADDLAYIAIRYDVNADNPASINAGTAVETSTLMGPVVGGRLDSSNLGTSFAPRAEGMAYTHRGAPGCVNEPPSSPLCLIDGARYYYSIFAVDTCGNVSDAAETSQTTVGQCGEETTGPTAGAAPAPANFNLSACSAYTFTWDHIDDAYPTGEYDMAGFYVYKSTTGDFNYSNSDIKASGLLLNPSSDPVSWSDLGTNPDTNSAYAGNTYMYYVMSIDCIREQNSDPTIRSNPWATVEPTTPAPTRSSVVTVRPGRVTFGNNTSVTTGFLTSASPFTAPNYYHNTVDVRLKNTSAASVKLKTMRASWVNSSAYLKTIYKKNADGTWTDIWTTASPVASGTTVTFGTALGVQGVGDVSNPWQLRFFFTESDGTVTNNQDMREDTVTVTNIEYDKIFTRDASEITPSCTYTTPETINVPKGPEFVATSHDRTSTEIVSSSLSPGYWVLGAGTDVNVYARVADSAGVGIESIKLYYTTTVTPADPTSAVPPALPYGNELPMYRISGTEYAIKNPITGDGAKIPSSPGMTIWYYKIAKDNKGNFDMAPERQDGVFTYSQKSFNPCEVTPMPPTGLTATPSGATVNLSWSAPASYTNGASINPAGDPLKYRIFRNGVQIVAAQAGTSYADAGLSAGVYSYYVMALNSCASPGPNVSDNSNTAAACVGLSGDGTLAVSGTDKDSVTAGLQIYQGDSYTATVVDCYAIRGGLENSPQTLNLSSGFFTFSNTSNVSSYNPQVPETGDATGTFVANIGTTGDVSESGKLLVGASDTITVSYTYAPTPQTVNVIKDPCTNTPKPPTGLGLSIPGTSASDWRASKVINVNFTAPQFNEDNSELVDLSSYSLLVKMDGADVGTVTIPLSTCTSSLSNPAAGATCSYAYTANDKMGDKIWSFEVRAVDSCSISSTLVSKGEGCTKAPGTCSTGTY